jgi:hypothetical protein
VFGTYSADLILYARDGSEVERKNLIRARDAIEDVRVEFISLELREGTVHLSAQGNHYHGTNEFRFPN